MTEQNPTQLLRSIIQRIAVGPDRGKDISPEEAQMATQALLNGQLDPVHAALFLIGLRMKRESLGEYSGIFSALQNPIQTVDIKIPQLVYLADPFDGYARHLPMSPFVPAVLAACKLPCLMQGVESVGPKFGITAHQVYKTYGANTNLSVKQASQQLQSSGCSWAYLDQQQSQPKLHALGEFRDQIIKRTAITTLERLLKPISAKQTFLALGYVHKAYPEIYAHIAQQAGYDKAVLVKGVEGGITPALNKPIRSFVVTQNDLSDKSIEDNHSPATIGMPAGVPIPSQEQTLAAQTLDQGLSALQGKQGIAYESLLLAGTTILHNLLPEHSYQEHLKSVTYALKSGSAKTHFDSILSW
ncbi:MAG: anthranilate phosphoribosyltransferase [Arenicella sp.]